MSMPFRKSSGSSSASQGGPYHKFHREFLYAAFKGDLEDVERFLTSTSLPSSSTTLHHSLSSFPAISSGLASSSPSLLCPATASPFPSPSPPSPSLLSPSSLFLTRTRSSSTSPSPTPPSPTLSPTTPHPSSSSAAQKITLNVNYKNSHGETALYLVSGMELDPGGIETLRLLIKMGGDIFIKTNSNQTVLHNAAASGCIAALSLFKELGHTNLNLESWEGSTPLLVATKHMQYNSLVYLLENGANVNARDLRGSTALFYCVRPGWYDGMALLIEKGANLKHMSYADSDSGEDILHYSLRYGHKHLVKLLMSKGAKLFSCGNCKKGKVCTRIRPEMTDWYKVKLEQAAKKGSPSVSPSDSPTGSPSPSPSPSPSVSPKTKKSMLKSSSSRGFRSLFKKT